MPNYPGPICGQQAVTSAPTALPSVIPGNPLSTGVNAPLSSSVRGEGYKVILTNIGSIPCFYGNNNNVSTANGKAIGANSTEPSFKVNDLAQIFVVAANNANSTISWSVTVDP